MTVPNTAEAKTMDMQGGYDNALRARVASNGTGPWTDVAVNDKDVVAFTGGFDTALRERNSSIFLGALAGPPTVAGYAGRRLDKCVVSGGAWTKTGLADLLGATATTAWVIGANMVQPAYVAGDYTLVNDNGQTMVVTAFNTAAAGSVANAQFTGRYAWAVYVSGAGTVPSAWTYYPVTRLDQPYPNG